MDASAVLILEARDNASAQLKHFGGAVEQAGRQAETAGQKTAVLGGGIGQMVIGARGALAPLRAFSMVMGTLGIGAIGIYTLTNALQGLIGTVIANQQAFLNTQLTLRRFGMSMDDAYARTKALQAVLGRTSMVEMAGMIEAFEDWRASMALTETQGDEVLSVMAQYAKWAGVTLPEAFKTLQDYQERFGKAEGLKKFTQSTKDAEKAVSDMKRAIVEFGQVMTPFWESMGEQAMNLAVLLSQIFVKRQKETTESWREATLSNLGWQIALGGTMMKFTEGMWQTWAGLLSAFDAFFREKWTAIGDWWAALTSAFGDFFREQWTLITIWWGNLVISLLAFFREKWEGFASWFGELVGNIGAFFVEKWTAIGKWWGELTTGIGDFWRGVWEGMKGVAISVYNFIADRLNDAIGLVNSVIRLFNQALGRIGISIPEIGLRIAHAAMPAPEVRGPGPVFAVPPMPAGAGGTIIIPVYIGDKQLTEIIVDSLTGAVRQRELPA